MTSSGEQDDRDVSLLALDQYLRQVHWTEPLTEAEEMQLLQCVERSRLEQSQSCPSQQVLHLVEQARDRLVQAYQPLVLSVAWRWLRRLHLKGLYSFELLDLVQEGNIGLLRAIERNQVCRGVRLSKLASRCMNDAIVRAVYDCGCMVRLPKDVHEVLARKWRAEQVLLLRLGREASLGEVAAEMGMAVEKLQEWVMLQQRGYVASLQALLTEEEDASNRLDFAPLYDSFVAADEARQAALRAMIEHAMQMALTPRQREVMTLRYGFDGQADGGRTQSEVAQVMGVPASSVWKRECLAKERLYQVLAPVCGIVPEEQSA